MLTIIPIGIILSKGYKKSFSFQKTMRSDTVNIKSVKNEIPLKKEFNILDKGNMMEEIFASYFENAMVGLTNISLSEKAELYHTTMYPTKEDEKYILITKEKDHYLLTTMDALGHVNLVQKAKLSNKNSDNNNPNKDLKLEEILRRTKQNEYISNRENFPADGIDKDIQFTNNQLSALILDHVYNIIRDLPLASNYNGIRSLNILKEKTGEQILKRFKEWYFMIDDPGTIIPDSDSPYVLPFITTSIGCYRDCAHCPEGGGMLFFSRKKIENGIKTAMAIAKEYHPNDYEELDEEFINTADLPAHDLFYNPSKNEQKPNNENEILRYSEMKAIEIINQITKENSNINKLGSFMGVKTILEMYKKEGDKYFKDLADAGLNRAYIGIETGHDLASKLLGKNETADEKLKAIEILKNAGIGVKLIMLVGAFGEGFYSKPLTGNSEEDKKNFISKNEIINANAKFVANAKPYRIMPSNFLPLKNIKWHDLIKTGRIIPYEQGIQFDKEYGMLIKKIEKIGGNEGYQGNLYNPNFKVVNIVEPYSEYVEGKKRPEHRVRKINIVQN